MPRQKSGNFDQKEYDKAYHKEYTYYKHLSLNRKSPEDDEIAVWLDSQSESISQYLKRLVKEDMQRRKGEL